MKKVLVYSLLLIAGLIGSQFLTVLDHHLHEHVSETISRLTEICLAFIMIRVGLEFDIDKSNVRGYLWDYVVAATAAAFPWIFCAVYFLFFLPGPAGADATSSTTIADALLAARFAAPTSAGILFSMLAACGLAKTWLFKKARILAILDDLDTIIFMIPLTMLIVGLQWSLAWVLIVISSLLWCAWKYLHSVPLPISWTWTLLYAVIVCLFTEGFALSTHYTFGMPIPLEVLVPAFAIGCVLAPPKKPHSNLLITKNEKRASFYISACFMALVGLSMPPVVGMDAASSGLVEMGWKMVALHVLFITILSNLGKMFPAFCYRKEASPKERLALAIGMFPRGEVGAGVITIAISLSIGGTMIAIAILSLTLNLILTGAFIAIIKRLLVEKTKV